MENNNFETLIAEVSTTNELLEEQNTKVDILSDSTFIILMAILFLLICGLISDFFDF